MMCIAPYVIYLSLFVYLHDMSTPRFDPHQANVTYPNGSVAANGCVSRALHAPLRRVGEQAYLGELRGVERMSWSCTITLHTE
jgi:hypothetical protein